MTDTDTFDGPDEATDLDLESYDPSDPSDLVSNDVDEESYLEEDSTALWDGDRGSLEAKQRDTLVMLLKKAFISSDDRAEWRTLTRDPGPIQTSLNNLYFNLVLDTRSEVAYAVPARTLDNPFKTLVKDTANSREETLLLIYLRERFRASTAAGEAHVYTDAIAMYDYVQRFRPASATDLSGDERKGTNAIASLVTAGLLVKTKDRDRYRVHRAIEALLPLIKLTQLLDAFRKTSADTTDDPTDQTDGAERTSAPPGKHAAPDTSAYDNAISDEEAAGDRLDVQYDHSVTFDHGQDLA